MGDTPEITTEDTPTVDIGALSDDQLAGMSFEDVLATVETEDTETTDTDDIPTDTSEFTDEDDQETTDDFVEETVDTEDDDPTNTDTSTDTNEDKETDTTEEHSDTDPDYKAEYEKLLTPFKANGKQVKVDSVDEAQRLMQMGADYHRKMTSLKPARKIVKLLENNGLLDEEKINFLIDLHSQNPDAITKLLKDAQVDPTAIDMDGDTDYQPQARTVGDNELALDDVLDSIKGTETYNKTMQVVTQDWDDESRNSLAQHPEVLGVINEHMTNGIYDQVSSLVDKQRQLGKLSGVSDINAYKMVGDYLYNQGQLITQKTPEQTKTDAPSPAQPEQKPVKASTNRRKKAAVKRTVPKNTSRVPVDTYSLSDEDFMKLAAPPYKYV